MTAEQVQIRRDTATNLNAGTPAAGEMGYDTTNKRMVIGDGVTAGGTLIPNASDVQKNAFGYAVAGGTADVLTLTLVPALLAYISGVEITFKAASTNTTSMTINVNTLGAKNIKKMVDGTLEDMEEDDVISGGIYKLFYDGTQFQIKGLQESGGNQGGLVLLDVQTASSVASLDFESLITADYNSYFFEFENIVAAIGGSSFCLRTSSNNGSSYDAAVSNYVSAFWYYGGSFLTGTNNSVGTSLFAMTHNGGTSTGLNGHLYLYSPLNTSYQKGMSFATSYGGTFVHGGGSRASASDVDAIRFLFNSGNISSGTIRMYGLRATL